METREVAEDGGVDDEMEEERELLVEALADSDSSTDDADDELPDSDDETGPTCTPHRHPHDHDSQQGQQGRYIDASAEQDEARRRASQGCTRHQTAEASGQSVGVRAFLTRNDVITCGRAAPGKRAKAGRTPLQDHLFKEIVKYLSRKPYVSKDVCSRRYGCNLLMARAADQRAAPEEGGRAVPHDGGGGVGGRSRCAARGGRADQAGGAQCMHVGVRDTVQGEDAFQLKPELKQ